MISKRQKNMHIYSVFALVLIFAFFFILKGGSASEYAENQENVLLSSTIPTAKQEDLSENRFDATKRQEQRQQDDARREQLQKNSFDLFESGNIKEEKSGCTPSQSVSNISNNNVKLKGGIGGKPLSGVGKDLVKEQIMRQKRAQLEQELGINLSDYGYDKYSDAEEESPKEYGSDDKTGFFGLDSADDEFNGDVKAVIHGDHNNVTSGSMIKMRLLEDVDIDGIRIPRNTFIFGKLSFKNGRARVQIQNINYRNKIIKFNALVYDTDGFEGLYVPDNKISDTKNKVASDIVGGVDVDVTSKSKLIKSTTQSVANTIKSAIQGSVRESKISISSNYSITIKRIKR